MSFDDEYDVVVVGFGFAGAAAAIGAAEAGARVLVLDRKRPGTGPRVTRPSRAGRTGTTSLATRPWIRTARGRARSELRRLRGIAVAAGVDVLRQSTAHEVLVEGDRVCGVGFATLDPRTRRGTSYSGLDRLGAWTTGVSETLGHVFTGAAEAVWQQASSVGMIRCSAIVLGMDRGRWDFVGPAVWAVMGSAGWRPEEQGRNGARRLLSVVPPSADPRPSPTPELALREWCAERETGRSGGLVELRVDRGSGAVHVGERGAVPGLYAATPEAADGAAAGSDAATCVPAAMRAGRAAANDRRCSPEGHLRLVV